MPPSFTITQSRTQLAHTHTHIYILHSRWHSYWQHIDHTHTHTRIYAPRRRTHTCNHMRRPINNVVRCDKITPRKCLLLSLLLMLWYAIQKHADHSAESNICFFSSVYMSFFLSAGTNVIERRGQNNPKEPQNLSMCVSIACTYSLDLFLQKYTRRTHNTTTA